jgi:DNA-binding MurR/RpiR family transcriptional regulator
MTSSTRPKKLRAQGATVAERLRAHMEHLTPAERKLADALFADYPLLGLKSMADFAKSAGVSTPSALRLAKKLGFDGYPAFQAAVRAELAERLQNPITKHARWLALAPQTHILNRFADAAMENLRASLERIDPKSFDAIVALLADGKSGVHVLGGRITGALAGYLHTHLQMARPQAHLLSGTPHLWPQQLININRDDVLFVFDVRRYDGNLLKFAASAKDRKAKVVLITDQWISPIARIADYTLPLRIAVPSSWDSNMVPLFVVEALVAALVARTWPATQKRITQLEALSDTMFGPK